MAQTIVSQPKTDDENPYVIGCEYRGKWNLWVEFNNGAVAVVDMSYLKSHPRFPLTRKQFRNPELCEGSVGWEDGSEDGVVLSPDDIYIRAGFATVDEMFPEPQKRDTPVCVKDVNNGTSIFVEFPDGEKGTLKVTERLYSGNEYPLPEGDYTSASQLAPWGDILWHGTTELCSECVKSSLLAKRNGNLGKVDHVQNCVQ